MRCIKVLLCAIAIATLSSCTDNDSASLNVGGGGQGQGGSLTRFAIQGNYLYTASKSTISVFDISTQDFELIKEENVGFGLETIVARGAYLYLGASDAMYIYSISNPENPQFIFRYSHIVSCDPVVVEGTKAYVTLSSGSSCNRGTNALEIIDISNPTNPTLIANYPMNSPLGLGISNNILFICEQEYGFKMYNVSNPTNIQLLDQVSDVHAYDVIVWNGIATVTGNTGIYQFSYANNELQQLSVIPITSNE